MKDNQKRTFHSFLRIESWMLSIGWNTLVILSKIIYVMTMTYRDNIVNSMHKLICWYVNFICTAELKLLCSKPKKLRTAYNDALRMLLRLPRWMSASQLFVWRGIPSLDALLRNCMFAFMMRLTQEIKTGKSVCMHFRCERVLTCLVCMFLKVCFCF